MMRFLAPLALALVLLTACGGMSSGKVMSKAYDPPIDYTYFICGAYTSQGVCIAQIPMIGTNPECWRLNLRNADDEGSVCVTRDLWGVLKVGDRWEKSA